MRYISHLDLIRLFMRALRRAGIPLYFTKGFSPHPRLIIKRALKVGAESENEEAEIILAHRLSARVFKDRLNRQLPQGIRITEAGIL